MNNTEYDVLVEEEARLIRLVFYDTDDDDNGYDGDDIGDDEGTCDYDNKDDNDDNKERVVVTHNIVRYR